MIPILKSPDLREAHDVEYSKGLHGESLKVEHPLPGFLTPYERVDYEAHRVRSESPHRTCKTGFGWDHVMGYSIIWAMWVIPFLVLVLASGSVVNFRRFHVLAGNS